MTAGQNHKIWKFHWLMQWDEIWNEGFIRQWRHWLDSSFSAHVFFHPALVRAWVDTYLPLRDLRPCFLIAESSENRVLLPLVVWRHNWKNAFQKLLVPIGYGDYDYHDPIVAGSEKTFAKRAFWAELAEHLYNSAPMRWDRFSIDGIRREFAGSGDGWSTGEICPWTDLSIFGRAEEFLPSLSPILRGELRRRRRRMQEAGEVQYSVFSSDEVSGALKELVPFLAAHQLRWPDAYEAPHFYENLVLHGLPLNIVRFYVLRINEESAAWRFGFIYKDRHYNYILAHRTEFKRFSPGHLLALRSYEDSIAGKLKVFDLLRGEEDYKSGWADRRAYLSSVQLDNLGLRCRFRNMAVNTVKPKLNAIIQCIQGRRKSVRL
jgi:CelD/BcsL family acetyltransferase involved in cellulose biosynthesis